MPSFNPSKLKAQLRAAVTRIGLAKGKRTSAVQNQKREIADLLRASPPRVEKARIRCEGVIRTDFTIEALEVLELFCLSLVERMGLIKEEKGCPPDLVEGVSTLIWAAPRAQIKELEEARVGLAELEATTNSYTNSPKKKRWGFSLGSSKGKNGH